ncbi:hypothetical protein ES703_112708 [subsurface metagenome]
MVRRNKNGFIMSSEYDPYIMEFLKKNSQSKYREIIDYIYQKIGSLFKSADTEGSYHGWIVWKHQVSEALFSLKKDGLIGLQGGKYYIIP